MKKNDALGILVYVVMLGIALLVGLLYLRPVFTSVDPNYRNAIAVNGVLFVVLALLGSVIFNAILIELGHIGAAKIGKYEIGIMIETPAAALCADDLAEEVDFFSLGTNDLTQYTCAIDRQSANLERFSNTHHPALLRLIRETIEAGHRHNTWVGICGELGADPELTEEFLKCGVDELSVNPKSVLPLRDRIREMSPRRLSVFTSVCQTQWGRIKF